MPSFDNSHWLALLDKAEAEKASDIHLAAGQKPFIRINGRLTPVELPVPDNEVLQAIVSTLLIPQQQTLLREKREIDFAWSRQSQRFRFNVYQQRGTLSLAGRLIPADIPTLADLGCPPLFSSLLEKEHGLILVTGRTGSGKTTTMAAFLNEVAKKTPRHIITLEDPVEYLLPTGNSFITQREYGTDFMSFAGALRGALRQAPDTILIGELRDADTIRTALDAASTGHLVLASLHTNSAPETVMRIESFFPAEIQGQIRTQLSIVLLASVAQQLLPATGGGRICAFEAMTATPAVRNLIRTGKLQQLKTAILAGKNDGMLTMEKSIEALHQAGKITAETARRYLEAEK